MRHPLPLALACTLALTACQPAATPAPTPATPAPAAPTSAAPLADSRTEVRQRLQAIVDGAHRSETDKARDAYRHPVETLSFFGLVPEATVIEVTPGAGWYADILAPFLRPHGKYVAAIWDESLPDQPAYFARLNQQLADKIAAAPALYGTPDLRRFDAKAPAFGPPDSADLVLTFRNAHNWIDAGTASTYFKAFFDVLKPGGVLGVVDHRAKDEAATDGSNGYVSAQQIIDLATAAGFRLLDRSEINANPADTADHPKGVWTLPPSYALGDTDREKYAAIGESDRFTLKFEKP